jgi:hypothetical protein
MWHSLHIVVRPFEALLGVFCLLTAGLLYPSEDGTIQSRLEDFWIRVDDYQLLAISRHTAFMTQVAKLESAFLDRMFGRKLFSEQSIVVSCWCSLVSFELAGTWFARSTHFTVLPIPFLFALLIGLSLALIAYVVLPRYHVTRETSLWLASAAIVVAGVWFLRMTPKEGLKSWTLAFVMLFVGGFCCDIIFIAATRRLIRWAGEMTQSIEVVGVLIFNLLLAIILVVPEFIWYRPVVVRHVNMWWIEAFAVVVSMSNLIDALFALAFIILAAILLVHRAVWPLLTRTLFRAQEIGTKGRRSILVAIGLALLGESVFGKVPDLVKELINHFGG